MGKFISKLCQLFRHSSQKVYQEQKEPHSYSKPQPILQNIDEDQEKQLPRPRRIPPVQFRWRLGELIGYGSYASVYLGMIEKTGKMIAVKQIELNYIDKARLEAFKQEITILRQLKHQNIVRYLEQESTGHHLNILLEYVAGGSIAQMIKRFGKFSESLIQSYLRQIINGLIYLHQNGILHRDIKGANVLVDTTGVCKLADFGCSIIAEEAYSLKGTPNWMAPEMLSQQQSGKKSDIWSLGCLVIEMLTAAPPWGRFQNPVQALLFLQEKNSAPPLPEQISEELRDFLERCLQVNPQDRWTAEKLLEHVFVKGGVSKARKISLAKQKRRTGGEQEKEEGRKEMDLQVKPQEVMKREKSELDMEQHSLGLSQSSWRSMEHLEERVKKQQ